MASVFRGEGMTGGARTATWLVIVAAVMAAWSLAVPPPAAGATPPDVTSVTIGGMPIVGRTLTAEVTVTGDPAPTVSYQWLRCGAGKTKCAAITGATGSSYVVTEADLGHSLAVRAKAVNEAGKDSGRSALTVPAYATPPEVTAVTIVGDAVVGRPLTARVTVTGDPAPSVSYQWLRCTSDECEPVDGATAATYVPIAADAGDRLAVGVVATNLAGADTRRSAATLVQMPPALTAVAIRGDAVVGAELRAAVTATGVPTPKVTYQWLSCAANAPGDCKPIPGATAVNYVVTDTDAGRRLILRARAVNAVGDVTGDSPATAPVPPVSRGPSFNQSGTLGATSVTPSARTVAKLGYLRPFPVIRIKGYVLRGGARVTLLRVRAPRGSKVVVRCRRSGCPLRRKRVGVGRIHALERYLRAGMRITIRVSRPGLVGKYVRIVIRHRKAPSRRDACLLPGSRRAAKCPRP